MVQFYIVTLIIDSVSCPTSGIKNQLIPFITTKTVTSNAASPDNPVHHHQDRHLTGPNAASPPHVDVPPAAPPPAEGGAGGIGM